MTRLPFESFSYYKIPGSDGTVNIQQAIPAQSNLMLYLRNAIVDRLTLWCLWPGNILSLKSASKPDSQDHLCIEKNNVCFFFVHLLCGEIFHLNKAGCISKHQATQSHQFFFLGIFTRYCWNSASFLLNMVCSSCHCRLTKVEKFKNSVNKVFAFFWIATNFLKWQKWLLCHWLY